MASPFDLSQTIAVPGSKLDVLHDLLFPSANSDQAQGGGGELHADDQLQTTLLNQKLQNEADDRAAADPSNARLQLLAKTLGAQAAADPLSQVTIDARRMKDQQAADAANQYADPAQAAMRQAQNVDAGQKAQAVGYGTEFGKQSADASPEAMAVQKAAADAKIREQLAAQGMLPNDQTPNGGQLPGAPPPAMATPAPGAATPPPGGAGTTSGDDDPLNSPRAKQILSSLDPTAANTVKAILEYRYPVPTGYALARSPMMRQWVQLANQIDPTFDATQYEAGQKMRNDLTTGELGDRLRSLNALSQHLGTLDDDRKQMGNFDVGTFNDTNPMNSGIRHLEQMLNLNHKDPSGADKYQQFGTTLGHVTAEGGKFLAGSTATNELRNSLEGGINQDSSDSQIQGQIAAIRKLVLGQYDSMHAQAGSVHKRLQRVLDQQLTPGALQLLQRAREDPNDPSTWGVAK